MTSNPVPTSPPSDPVGEPERRYEFIRRFRRNRLAVFGLFLVLAMTILAIFAPQIAPLNPNVNWPNGISILGAPIKPFINHKFILGTDPNGRDELSRLIYGSRVSLEIGIAATAITLVIGTLVGVVAGYAQGVVDTVLMRLTDVMLAFPFILFVLMLDSILTYRSVTLLFLIIGILGWAPVARIARGQTLTLVHNDYVEAARAVGISPWRVMLRHVLPNAFSPILVFSTLQIGNFILVAAALSFLGAGVPPPTASWGKMLNSGLKYYLVDPYLLIWPGIMLAAVTLGFNLLGDGLDDALNPKSRPRG